MDGAVVDPATWQVVVLARRARRFAGGKLTGHAWTDVEVRGDLPSLLGGVIAIGSELETRGNGADEPVAGSSTAPAIAARAEVQPRRRA